MSRVCRCLSRKKVTPSLEDGFSPVGIPAEPQPRSAFESKVPEETEPCPGCGTIYTPNANYCAHCGRRRGPPKEPSPSPVSEVKPSASPLPTQSSPARENLPKAAPEASAAPAQPAQPAPYPPSSTSRQAAEAPLPTAKACPSQRLPAEAPAAAISKPSTPSTPARPSEPSAPAKEGNYVVQLRREKPTDRYGFAWDANFLEKQNLRVINKILPGTLAAAWNASAPPGCDIRSGDLLVKVNGREGRLELMTVELSKQHVVCEFQPKEARVFGGAVDVALPEASSAVTPSVPKVPPAKSAMEQPQVALPEASSAVTPSVPKVPPAKSAMEQPQVALPEASSAVTPSVQEAPPKSTMEQPKVTVQILEDSDSSSELEDKTPPCASTAQASHVAQLVTSSSSCLAVDTERPPESDHPSLEVVEADVPSKVSSQPEDEHPKEEVRAKAAPLQRPEDLGTERECIVDLERGAVSEKWGFQWDREAMDRQQQRVISAVAPNSLAEDWNRRFPGRAVRKGYRLVKVNGVEDYGGIAGELKKKQISCHFEAGH